MPEKAQDFLKTAIILALASVFAYYAKSVGEASDVISVTYVLVVVLISRMTNGYMWGILASVFGVLSANFIFTAPYFEFNFTLTGYPFTFFVMLVSSIMISTLTQKYKQQKEQAEDMARKLQESYLKQIQIERATEKEKMKNHLLRAISHDLRTPLTSIIGSATLYLENGSGMQEKEKDELICHILEDSNWLLNMVENLLSVTRINNETARVKKTEEPVEEVMAEAVARLKKRLPEASVKVSIPDEFIMIPMDAILIEQVLINLMENAIVHAESPQPVECYTKTREDAVEFHVRDYGIGIPEERMDSIFDGATRTDARLSDSRKGMGIGLTICKTIVLAHGGEIFAKNCNPGAEFWFTLPREKKEENAAARN